MFARNPENADRTPVTVVTPFAVWARRQLRALGFNPLVRVADRLEAFAVLAVLITALVAVPLATAAEAMVYESGSRTAKAEALTRHSVQALVIEGSGLPADFDSPAYVRAQWHEGTQTRTEQIVSPATVTVGDQMTVWLDDSGKVVAAPLKTDDAKLNAIAAAVAIWITIVTCSVGASLLIRSGLDRSRDRAWDRELHLMAHNDDGWANRHI